LRRNEMRGQDTQLSTVAGCGTNARDLVEIYGATLFYV
jgi:hypothetical protein